MSPEAVTARLRLLARRSSELRRGSAVDMSPEAVTSRLQETSDLAELGARLSEIGAPRRAAARGPG